MTDAFNKDRFSCLYLNLQSRKNLRWEQVGGKQGLENSKVHVFKMSLLEVRLNMLTMFSQPTREIKGRLCAHVPFDHQRAGRHRPPDSELWGQL